MKNIAVVILNYNGSSFLEKFLGQTVDNSPEADIVVIDNASTDGSIAYLQQHFPTVQLIRLPVNYGFAEGYNRGLEALEHPYFVLLNSDVQVTPGWLNPLLAIGNQHPEVAAVQPKIRSYYKKGQFEYAGAAGGHMDVFGFPFCRGRVFDHCEEDIGQYDDASDVFWASGACFFVRSKVFKQLGGFDARFFAHMEEIDLCWRMHNAGYRVMVEPSAVVYHVGAGTLAATHPTKTYLNFRNSLATMAKNLPAKYVVPLLFMRLSLDGVSGIRFLLLGQPAHLWAVLRSHFSFYSWLPYLLSRRAKDFNGFAQLYRGAVVWDYFVKQRKTFTQLWSK